MSDDRYRWVRVIAGWPPARASGTAAADPPWAGVVDPEPRRIIVDDDDCPRCNPEES